MKIVEDGISSYKGRVKSLMLRGGSPYLSAESTEEERRQDKLVNKEVWYKEWGRKKARKGNKTMKGGESADLLKVIGELRGLDSLPIIRPQHPNQMNKKPSMYKFSKD